MESTKIDFIIPAAGSGRRMGKNINKVLLPLHNRPLLQHTLGSVLSYRKKLNRIIIVMREEDSEAMNEIKDKIATDIPLILLIGGRERRDSVRNALCYLEKNDPAEIIMVHDAARPNPQVELIERLFHAAFKHGAAVPILQVQDTVWQIQKNAWEKLSREHIFISQTPQAFHRKFIKSCFMQPIDGDIDYTDENSYLQYFGIKVEKVQGREDNIKVTTPFHLSIMEYLLA